VTVIAVALTHYEGLVWINRQLAKARHAKRRVLPYAVLSLIALHRRDLDLRHSYHLLLMWPATGRISGAMCASFFDHVYFSAAVFTTVGFGDLSPTGLIRFVAGAEALTGFVLIGWSASFTNLEMEHLWKSRR